MGSLLCLLCAIVWYYAAVFRPGNWIAWHTHPRRYQSSLIVCTVYTLLELRNLQCILFSANSVRLQSRQISLCDICLVGIGSGEAPPLTNKYRREFIPLYFLSINYTKVWSHAFISLSFGRYSMMPSCVRMSWRHDTRQLSSAHSKRVNHLKLPNCYFPWEILIKVVVICL
jgi:hypothetical protein